MDKKRIKSKYEDYRKGNPVIVNGVVTVIAADPPVNTNDPFGYKVAGSADGVHKKDIEPIPLSTDILKHFGAVYEADGWHYSANRHDVVIADDRMCFVDGEGMGYVPFLHQFKNLLFDKCEEFVLRRFTGIPSK